MKKKLLTVLVFSYSLFHLSSSVSMAQVANIEFFPKGKAVAKTYDSHFIGCKDGHVVLAETTGRLKNKTELACYDLEQNELARTTLSNDKEVLCYGGYINGQYIDLLMVNKKDNGMRVYRNRLGINDLQPINETLTLVDYKEGQSTDNYFNMEVSPNQNLLAAVFSQKGDNQTSSMQVGLYNRELEERWKMESRCKKSDLMYVNDSGSVLLANYSNGMFHLYILDGKHEEEYSFEAATAISEARIARYAGGKVFIVYTHTVKTYRIDAASMVDQTGVFCYDTKTRNVTVKNHIIDKTEYNRLSNEKDDAKVKGNSLIVPFMDLNQTLEDNDGCYAMFDQTWRVDLDGEPHEHHRQGMMVCRIDDDGNFAWIKTFRIATVAPWYAKSLASHRWVMTGEGPMLVWVENKRSIDRPDEKRIEPFYALDDAGTLTAMLIDRDGRMTRQHYEIPSKQSLMGSPHLLDNGDYLLLLRDKSKGYFAQIKK